MLRDTIVVENHTLWEAIAQEIEEHGDQADLNHFDTSRVTRLNSVFSSGKGKFFNGNISGWDVSNVESASNLFTDSYFKGSLSKWDVRRIKKINEMFYDSKYSGDLSTWHLDSLEYDDLGYNVLSNRLAILPPRFGAGFSSCDIKTYDYLLTDAYGIDYHYRETQDNPWIRKLYRSESLHYNHAIASLVYGYPCHSIHPLFTQKHADTLERLYAIHPHVHAVSSQWEQMLRLPSLDFASIDGLGLHT